MTRKLRLLYFGVVVSVFLILSPILLFYVAGYRYNSDNRSFQKTGTIHLRTYPKGASVVLNNESQDLLTPASYNGLREQPYTIRVEKEGYRSWQKLLPVKEGLVTRTDLLYLFPDTPAKDELLHDDILDFALSPDGDHAAVITKDTNTTEEQFRSFSLSDPDKPLSLATTRSFSTVTQRPFERDVHFHYLSWSPDDKYLLLAYSQQDTLRSDALQYAVFEVKDNGNVLLLDMLDHVPFHLVRWHPSEKSTLVFQDAAGQLFMQSFTPSLVLDPTPLVNERVQTFDLHNEYIYYLKESDHLVYRTSFTQSQHEQLTRIPLQAVSYDFVNGQHFFHISREGEVVFMDEQHSIYVLDSLQADGFRKIDDNVSLFSWQLGSGKIAYTIGNELWVYYVKKKETYPQVDKGQRELITRLSEPITFIRWFYSYEYIMYSTPASLRVAEIDGRDVRNVVELTTLHSLRPFFDYNPDHEMLYVWDEGLYGIPLKAS